jgi:uncharacterized OB-fold protein
VPPVPDRPDLVTLDEAGHPLLRVGRCRRCTAIAFPPQEFGCEHCGAHGEDLETELLAPTGTVLARATVHRDLFGRPVPYTIIELALDGGPAIRALLGLPDGGTCAIGDRVHGILADPGVDAAPNEHGDVATSLVFVPGGHS